MKLRVTTLCSSGKLPMNQFKFTGICLVALFTLCLVAIPFVGRVQNARSYFQFRKLLGARPPIATEFRNDHLNNKSKQMTDMGIIKIPSEEGMTLRSGKGFWQATSPSLSVTRVNPRWVIPPAEFTLNGRNGLSAELNHSFLDCLRMDQHRLRSLCFRLAYEIAQRFSLDRIVSLKSRTIGIGRLPDDRSRIAVWIELGDPPRHTVLQLHSKDMILTDEQVIGWAAQVVVSDIDNVETEPFPDDLPPQ